MNNEMILLGFGIIALLTVWRVIVRRSALDHYRDQLFDLRESVRNYYLSEGYGLEDSTYRELRLLINNQIRFLNRASLTKLIVCGVEVDTNKELRDSIKEDLERRFATKDKVLSAYITSVRLKAYHHTSGYILHSSLGLSSISYLLFPVFLICVLAHESFKFSRKVIVDSLFTVQQKAVSRDVIEGFSRFQPELQSA